jgi:hypothetical protein
LIAPRCDLRQYVFRASSPFATAQQSVPYP